MRIEAMAVRRGAPRCQVEVIGMGPGRATAARARLGASLPAPTALALVGIAGGLSEQFSPGDLLVASSVTSTEGGESIELSCAAEVTALLNQAGLSARLGALVSSPRLVRGKSARQALQSYGDAVDMESLWCASLASQFPFVVVRAISDTPERELFRPSFARDALRALSALSRAARALSSWSPSTLRSDPLMEACDL